MVVISRYWEGRGRGREENEIKRGECRRDVQYKMMIKRETEREFGWGGGETKRITLCITYQQ